ncbi:metal ABC transporter permease [Aestuariivirga litoralis]|uniref:metal ABC transporter permease n=1 Tax=Aestuariivirga litoralis TaxID=2650924 RepID=UPI0018C76BF4|nr:metal ABC transporter permease [Aestuariivirga litoralis]MBG1232599.1 metal ABC transporter permease [Aestuariivirga litoralis]
MILYDLLIAPFVDFDFMRRALAGSVVLSLSAGPVGVFLVLRRMSLAADGMSHAILPGMAVCFLLFGLQILPMTFGGLIAGLIVAFLAGAVSRLTLLREDASLAAFYLMSLAFGVLLISVKGTSVDLVHILFGSVLALNDQAMALIGAVATVTMLVLAVIWRALFLECLDPSFLRSVSKSGGYAHFAFLGLVALNLVAGFQALGTLLAVGLIIVPAVSARFWVHRLEPMCLLAATIGVVSSYVGLLASYHFNLATGPSVILVAGLIYIASLLFAPKGVLAGQAKPHHHKRA